MTLNHNFGCFSGVCGIAGNVEALLSGLEIELLKFKIYSDVQ